jgi:predicted TPR repeat methyltransferase
MKKKSSYVKIFFDGYSKKFEKITGFSFENRVVLSLNLFFRQGMKRRYEYVLDIIREYKIRTVLDVGCGPGIHDIEIANKFNCDVTGIDFSEQMIELANLNLSTSGDQNCKFIISELSAYSSSQKYDLVFALGVFEYIENLEDAICMSLKLSRSHIIFSLPVKFDFWMPQRYFRYKLRNCPLFFYSKSGITKILHKLSVKNYKIIKFNRDYIVHITV